MSTTPQSPDPGTEPDLEPSEPSDPDIVEPQEPPQPGEDPGGLPEPGENRPATTAN